MLSVIAGLYVIVLVPSKEVESAPSVIQASQLTICSSSQCLSLLMSSPFFGGGEIQNSALVMLR